MTNRQRRYHRVLLAILNAKQHLMNSDQLDPLYLQAITVAALHILDEAYEKTLQDSPFNRF